MHAQSPQPTRPDVDARLWPRALVLGLAVVLCYASSLHAPFLLDDPRPDEPLGSSDRHVLWASFHLNRALSGGSTWSFHVFNMLVHLACGLVLWGVLRRSMTLVAPGLAASTREGLAFVTTLLWLCHPLQTAAITYIIQRAEAMAAFLYLAVLYAFLRATSSARPRRWQAAALASLALGFATKETIATAPLVVWSFDALFLAGGPLRALRLRPVFYAALGLVTFVLALVFIFPLLSGATPGMGFKVPQFGPLEYARTQPGVLLHYLRLVIWPHPLCFDYFWPIAKQASDYLPQSTAIALLLLASGLLLVRRSWIGLACAFFFLVLAPTSSFVPLHDPAFEHRMYLPLAAALLLVVVGAWWLRKRFLPRAERLGQILAATAALGLVATTIRRNQDYRTAVRLWEVTVACAPNNPRAHNNLGAMLLEEGRVEEAIPQIFETMRLAPVGYFLGFDQLNLGLAYLRLEQPDQAIPFLERAQEGLSMDARCPNAIGRALAMKGDHPGAILHFRRALELSPDSAEGHFRLAESLRALGRFDEALAGFQEASRLAPELAAPYAACAETVCMNPAATLDQRREAVRLAQKADEITASARPEYAALRARARAALDAASDALLSADEREPEAALGRYGRAVEQHPNDAQAHFGLACALGRLQRSEEAVRHYQETLRLAPEHQEAHINLAALLARAGRTSEALEHSQRALAILPNSAEEHFNAAQSLRAVGRFDEAMAAFLEATRLAPEMPEPYAAYAKTVCLKPDASDEERREALRMARRANELARSKRADFLEVGAETEAALGDYGEAVRLVEQALALPGPTSNQVFARRLRTLLEDYLRKAGR